MSIFHWVFLQDFCFFLLACFLCFLGFCSLVVVFFFGTSGSKTKTLFLFLLLVLFSFGYFFFLSSILFITCKKKLWCVAKFFVVFEGFLGLFWVVAGFGFFFRETWFDFFFWSFFLSWFWMYNSNTIILKYWGEWGNFFGDFFFVCFFQKRAGLEQLFVVDFFCGKNVLFLVRSSTPAGATPAPPETSGTSLHLSTSIAFSSPATAAATPAAAVSATIASPWAGRSEKKGYKN